MIWYDHKTMSYVNEEGMRTHCKWCHDNLAEFYKDQPTCCCVQKNLEDAYLRQEKARHKRFRDHIKAAAKRARNLPKWKRKALKLGSAIEERIRRRGEDSE